MTIRTFACAALVAATAAIAAPVASAQQIKLSFADQNSATAWGPVHALQPWVKQVEEATKGRVKIEVYPSQTLVKGVDMWKAASSGTIDMGWCVQSTWPDLTPLSEVVSLPGLPADATAENMSGALWRLYEKYPAIRKEYDGANIEPLILYTTASYFIASRKEVRSLEDMKGLKVRALGAPAIEYLKSMGAVPLPIPAPDMYQALDKGVVDAAGLAWEPIHGFRIYEVTKSVTLAPLPRTFFSVCANKAKMQRLPAEVRDAIRSVGGLAGSRYWGKQFFDTAETGVAEALKASGRELTRITLPQAELDRWQKLAEPIQQDWVKRMEAKGFGEAREVLASLLTMLKE